MGMVAVAGENNEEEGEAKIRSEMKKKNEGMR